MLGINGDKRRLTEVQGFHVLTELNYELDFYIEKKMSTPRCPYKLACAYIGVYTTICMYSDFVGRVPNDDVDS